MLRFCTAVGLETRVFGGGARQQNDGAAIDRIVTSISGAQATTIACGMSAKERPGVYMPHGFVISPVL
jgi:hypothetical protein